MQDLAQILEKRIQDIKDSQVEPREIDPKFIDLFLKTFKLGGDLKELIEKYLSLKPQTSLIWLSLSECTGCTESFLRNESPGIESILLDFMRLDYHDVVMADSGFAAKTTLEEVVKKGNYLLVIEGGICDGFGENYSTFGAGALSGKKEVDHLANHAEMIFGVGTCAAFGGVQAAHPNPSNAVGMDALLDERISSRYISITGCPPSDINIVMNLMYVITFGVRPELDSSYRPLWGYGKTVHDSCERKAKFESGDFVQNFQDETNKAGYCLYKVGCKGPYAFNNCGKIKFNGKISWPIQAGHGCIACSEANFWDEFGVYEEPLKKGLKYFGKNQELPEPKAICKDKDALLQALSQEKNAIGVFFDSHSTEIIVDNENILQSSFESNVALILDALAKKSKLTARLVENYQNQFSAFYDSCIQNGTESNPSTNPADVLKVIHQLLSLDQEENPHLRAVKEAHEFEFSHISDMDFSAKIVDGKIVVDISKGLRLPLCYSLGGLEYDGIAYGVLATLCKTIKSGIYQYKKEKNFDSAKVVLGGDLAQNALVQKWMLD